LISAFSGTGFNPIRHDDGRVESEEMLLIEEKDRLPSLDHVANCDVEKDDFGVRGCKFGSKFPFNVVPISA
jgi:hypothetical protein